MAEANDKKITPSYPETVTKEQLITTLREEGMFPTVKIVSEITDNSIIMAQHNVIKKLQETRFHLRQEINQAMVKDRDWYRAAQKANITVSRDESGKIVLVKVPLKFNNEV